MVYNLFDRLNFAFLIFFAAAAAAVAALPLLSFSDISPGCVLRFTSFRLVNVGSIHSMPLLAIDATLDDFLMGIKILENIIHCTVHIIALA